jgi:hypothetical protein
MIINKAKQILLNEQRKIRSKIEMKRREIVRLESDLKEIEELLKKS